MLFNTENYAAIKKACEDKKEIEFVADLEITAFSVESVPIDWTSYPPSLLPPEGYAQVMIYASNDIKGALTRLEVVVYLDGGRIMYKSLGNNRVAIKVTWPNENT